MPKTNMELLEEIMNYSRQGGLIQGFVMEGLRIYSAQVVARQEELKKSMADSFVSPEAWIACAKEVLEKLESNREK